MELFFNIVAVALALLMGLVLIRAITGPTVIDRILGVNLIGTKTTVMIIIAGTIFNRVDMFVDIALGYALLNFIASLAASRFFLRYPSMHPEEKPTTVETENV